jgi:Mrp family chromosome partitioning ATPase
MAASLARRAGAASACRLLRTAGAATQPASGVRTFSIAPHIHDVAGTSQSFQQPTPEVPRGEVVVITSGKGGVGKTTTAASFGYGLAAAVRSIRPAVAIR